MKLNRFPRSQSTQSKKRIAASAIAARPMAIESLEDRQLMSVTFDLRTNIGTKVAVVTSVGQVVTMDLYAVVSGNEAGANDGFVSVAGSLISNETNLADSVAGNLQAMVTPDYTANGASEGTQQDLTGQGNLDVGSNDNSQIEGFMNARAGGVEQDGTVSGNTQTFEVATVTYTVTNLRFGSETDVNFRIRAGLNAGAFDAIWLEDGNPQNDASGTVDIGTPVTFSDPDLSAPSGVISGTVTKSVSGSTSGFSGVTVYLDTNNDGVLDSGDNTAVTTSNGSYSFTGLSSGTYDLREVVPSGYSQTSPGSSPTVVSLASNSSSATGENFTDTAATVSTASIAGTVTKVVSGTTSDFSGVTVSLTNNSSVNTSTTTSSSGTYSFTGLPAGTYDVTETVPSGYTQTSPGSSPTVLMLTSGQSSTNDNFTDTASTTTTPGTLLSGSVIGTSGSYQNDGNTIAKAFDGSVSTYYDGASANGNWAGLNLGGQYTITQVEYSPRSGWAGRMVGGIFQGSDDPTFSTGVTNLATISATPTVGVYTTLAVSNTSTFEYVRYLSPSGSYGDVAELQFYGTGTKAATGQLTGSVIGTSGSYQNDGNTIAKVFDGSLTTFYDGASANGNSAGLNLGSTYQITSINYAPRSGWASRMVGGVFQGSNSATFTSGVVNLATISSTPAVGSFTSISVSNTSAFQYVRYMSPAGSYGDVAEIQFFGTAKAATGTTQLTGTVIGTSGSYQNDGNTIANVFDGNLSTFFDGPTANGDSAGLAFSSAQNITSISYAPRANWASRMVGGSFQASNSSTFSSGVVNLFTITATPAYNTLTTVSVNVTGSYLYVRYVGPTGSYGDVAEVEFF